MVAGGVGLAPFATLAEALRARGTATTLFYGARSGRELFYLDWFRDPRRRLVLATEDGSAATAAASRCRSSASCRTRRRRSTSLIYACGPEPMLEAVAHVAAKYGRPSQVSVERVMGCGLGGCYSCVIPVRDGPRRPPLRPVVHRRAGLRRRRDRVGLG